MAAVAVYRANLVVFVNAQEGKIVKKLTVPAEPYGIVANKAGTVAWVTHEYPGLVSELDLQQMAITGTAKVGAFVRGLALSPDESRLYVSEFYTAVLHAVDLRPAGQRGVVDSWKGHSADNLCRHVEVHPLRPKAYLSHIRSKIERNDGSGSIFPHLSICDLVAPNGSKRRTSIALDTYNNVRVVTNAWEAALSPNGKRLYTIYAGTNDMNISEVVDDDYREIERLGRAVNVGKNPRAVRGSPDGRVVYVYNALDFTVSFHEAQSLQRLATVQGCA